MSLVYGRAELWMYCIDDYLIPIRPLQQGHGPSTRVTDSYSSDGKERAEGKKGGGKLLVRVKP